MLFYDNKLFSIRICILLLNNLLVVITSRLIHLIFNYRPGLVGLELTQIYAKVEGFLWCCGDILTDKRSKDISK